MKRPLILLASGLAIVAAVSGLAALRPDPQPPIEPTAVASGTPPVDLEREHSGIETNAGPAANARASAAPEPERLHPPADARTTFDATPPAADTDVPFEDMLQQPLRQVAATYEAQTRFPTFSQPIRSSAELLRYKPHQPQTVSLPFPTPDGGTYQANLTLDRYRYFKGDHQRLTLDLSTSGGTLIGNVRAQVTTLAGDPLFRLPLQLGTATRITHTQSVDLSDAWRDWPMELQWKISARVGEQDLSVVAPFRYEVPVAVLENIGPVRVSGEFLVIPLAIDTELPGYYFVQANLYSRNGTPLVHLQTEGPLTPDHPPLQLQAAGAVFRHLNEAGPYVLRDIQLERLGGEDQPDRYGRARQDDYAVQGYPLTDYADSTWTDALAEQRLDFLRSLGGSDSPN